MPCLHDENMLNAINVLVYISIILCLHGENLLAEHTIAVHKQISTVKIMFT